MRVGIGGSRVVLTLVRVVVSAVASGAGAQGGQFQPQEIAIPAAADYQGVALGDATAEVYLYLAREQAQGSLFRWHQGRAAALPLPPQASPGSEAGAGWADYDLDGDLDLFVSRYNLPHLLYRNDAGAFRVAADGPGQASGPGQGVSWVDADRDGDLDLYVTQYGEPNQLYLRQPDGTWAERGAALGLADPGPSSCAVWGDVDGDGDLDVYVVNHQSRDELYRYDGSTYTPAGNDHRLADEGAGVGAAWVDYDNDGDLDLSLARYGEPDRLYENDGEAHPRFRDAAPRVRLDDRGQGQLTAWGDFDRDGLLDAFVVNGGEGRDASRLYRNGGERFDEVSVETGVIARTGGAARQSKAAIWWDADEDGDLDLLTVARGDGTGLLRNDGLGGERHWAAFRIESAAEANRYAIGGRLTVHADGGRRLLHLGAATGYLSQGSQRAFVGLGGARVDSVALTWPHEEVALVERPKTDVLHVIDKGPAVAEVPRSLDFEEVQVGTQKTRLLSVRNAGESVLRLEGRRVETVDADAWYTVVDPDLPVTVNPGQALALTVAFAPTAERSARGDLRLVANVDVPPIQLEGRGVPAGQIVIAPTVLRLAAGDRGRITLTNEKAEAVTVVSAEVYVGIGATPAADVYLAEAIKERSLGPGESLAMTVKASSSVAEPVQGLLKVRCVLADGTPRYLGADIQVMAPVRHLASRPPGALGAGELDWRKYGPLTVTAVGGIWWWIARGALDDANQDLERSAFRLKAQHYRREAKDKVGTVYLSGLTLLAGLAWGGYEYWWSGVDGPRFRLGIDATRSSTIVLRVTKGW